MALEIGHLKCLEYSKSRERSPDFPTQTKLRVLKHKHREAQTVQTPL